MAHQRVTKGSLGIPDPERFGALLKEKRKAPPLITEYDWDELLKYPENKHFDKYSDALYEKLGRLHTLWADFEYLYLDPERQKFLQCPQYGQGFWQTVRHLMLSEVFLAISRLTDPPKLGKNENLVLKELIKDPRITSGLKDELKLCLKCARKRAKPVRRWRDKLIAHSDLEVAFDLSTLPGFSRDEIGRLIELLECIHRRHCLQAMRKSLDYSVYSTSNVKAVVKKLQGWKKAREIFLESKGKDDQGKLEDWGRTWKIFTGNSTD